MKAAMPPQPRKPSQATLARAEFLLSTGDPAGSMACARAVLRKDPEQLGALEVLAKALWQLARYDELLITLSTLIRLNPYEPGYHALRGAALQSLGRAGEAIKCFGRVADRSDTAAAAVEELRRWQQDMISDLIQEDPLFRAQYEQNPVEACQARGFDLLPECEPTRTWFATAHAQGLLHTRPS